ncbi:hypothetical protein ACFSC4_23915 [Deinococcus malanensis]|uniref:hypothetical protein n=1 Tax=Deinococcus malanensis TaxID=1706855 RepID=UPI003638B923
MPGARNGGSDLRVLRGRPQLSPLVQDTGADGIWTDDFHHQVRVVLTGEQDGYYAAYRPDVADLARCIERGGCTRASPGP